MLSTLDKKKKLVTIIIQVITNNNCNFKLMCFGKNVYIVSINHIINNS